MLVFFFFTNIERRLKSVTLAKSDLGERGIKKNNLYVSCHVGGHHVHMVERTSELVEHMGLRTCRQWI